MGSDLTLDYQLASGETGLPGYHVFQGVDLTAPISGFGAAAPSPAPMAPAAPLFARFYDIFVRGWVTRDPNAKALEFDLEHPGPWKVRMSALSLLMASNNPDLVRFAKHGGKLIIVHGNDDALVPVGWTQGYYRNVVRTMGASSADGFLRFYSVPGYGHGVGAFTVDWDSLSALDAWVERDAAPTDPVATDINPAGHHRTRPLCRYPAWPRYKGAGDIDAAASFSCVGP
jgi:feruloyl esterase